MMRSREEALLKITRVRESLDELEAIVRTNRHQVFLREPLSKASLKLHARIRNLRHALAKVVSI